MLNDFGYLSSYAISSDYSYYIKYKAIQDSENHAEKNKNNETRGRA